MSNTDRGFIRLTYLHSQGRVKRPIVYSFFPIYQQNNTNLTYEWKNTKTGLNILTIARYCLFLVCVISLALIPDNGQFVIQLLIYCAQYLIIIILKHYSIIFTGTGFPFQDLRHMCQSLSLYHH